MSADLQNPIFTDEIKARETLERLRWPNGVVCVHCEATGNIALVEGKKKTHRPGLYFCNHCQMQFTVTVGTVFERSKIPLTKWWMAVYLLSSSKKGMSSHQLHRMLGVTYKTAWFMTHRIREAMSDGWFKGPIGGEDKTVEVDETYVGRKEGRQKARGVGHKHAVVTLVERGGKARSFHIAAVTAATLTPIMKKHIAKDTNLTTDEAGLYVAVNKRAKGHFAAHESVTHSENEYARGPIHTNTVEGFFSILKRGLFGTYHHVSEQHLNRYVGEFDFRYNNRTISDFERAQNAMRGINGKRLTYRRTCGAALV